MAAFILHCDNLLQSETFSCRLIPADSSVNPMEFKKLKLDAGKSYQFDYDTVGWEWHTGDSFAIIDRKGNVKKRWSMSLPVYTQPDPPLRTATPDNRRRQCEQIRIRIDELQEKLRQTDWDIKMMQLKDMDVSSHHVYMSYVQLRSQYQRNISELQNELMRLETL